MHRNTRLTNLALGREAVEQDRCLARTSTCTDGG